MNMKMSHRLKWVGLVGPKSGVAAPTKSLDTYFSMSFYMFIPGYGQIFLLRINNTLCIMFYKNTSINLRVIHY